MAGYIWSRSFFFLVSLCIFFTGCSGYGHKVAPISLPENSPNSVQAGGALMTANAFVDPKRAKEYFGFDIRGAGVMPVQVVIDNKGASTITIDPSQTFLIDAKGQAWPLLSQKEAYRRIEEKVKVGEIAKGTGKPALLAGSAGALLGFAIGIVSGHDVGKNVARGAAIGATAGALTGGAKTAAEIGDEISSDIEEKSLRNMPVPPNTLAHGFLFFPGAGEAESAVRLRLGLDIDGRHNTVVIPLQLR